MDPNSIFLAVVINLNLLIFALVSWTLYEYIKLDKELFRFYIIGLAFYGITVLCFFFEYILLPPLGNIENLILSSSIRITPLIGMFYFIKGTEYLAKQEKSDFVRDDKLHNLVLYLIIGMSIFEIVYLPTILISESIYSILNLFSVFFFLTVVFLGSKLLLEYHKSISGIFAKIIYLYILAVVFLIAGGILLVEALGPIETGDKTYTDLSYFRKTISVIGVSIIVVPFISCYRSVSKFRMMYELDHLVRKRTEHLEKSITQLQKLDQMKSDFISMISHEFRTPLTVIQGYAGLLEEEPNIPEKNKSKLKLIIEESNHLREIIDKLLEVSRIEAGDMHLHKKEYNLSNNLRKLFESWCHVCEKNHKYSIEIGSDIEILADQTLIRTVITNLISNAHKYTQEGGTIDVELTDHNDHIQFKVKDNGIGISKEDQKQIFDLFYLADKGFAREADRMGLGLFTTKKIIEMHNGKIWCESEKGKGSTFYFTLPTERAIAFFET